MRKLMLYITLCGVLLFSILGCAEKKVDVGKDNVANVSLPILENVVITKSDNKYELNISSDAKDVSVFYGKNPYALTVIVPGVQVSTEAMKYSFSDDLVENVSVIPRNDQAIVSVKLKDDVDYNHTVNDKGIKVNFKVDKADVKTVLKSSGWFESIDIVNIGNATYISDFENLSDEGNLLIRLSSDGAAKVDYGYINNETLYVDFYDIKFVSDKSVFNGKGLVKDIKVVSSLFPQKVRFLITVSKGITPSVGFKDGKYIITSNLSDLNNSFNLVSKIESRKVGDVQGINITSTGNVQYEKKIIDGNLVLLFKENVRFSSGINPVMFFESAPIKYVKVGKVSGKPAVVFVPNGDVYSKVENDKGGIVVYSSDKKFSKPSDIEVKTSGGSNVSASDLISLSIKDMDVKEAVKLIYYGRNKNIIFGKEVQGKTSIFVKDVHYKTALAAIYRENNLVEVEEDNVIWVIGKARQDEILAEKAKLIKIAEENKKVEPLFTEIIAVNYYKASDFDAVVKGVLSPRGKSQVESKSNSFVITDTRDAIEKVKGVLKNVDKPTPQVNIEARIVEVADSNDLALGIKWGVNTNINRTSVNFPGTIGINGDAGGYMVNLPVGNPAGALALTLGNLSNSFNINLAISAMEARNRAKTISSPKITTLDNQEAEIKSGGKAIIVPSGDNTASQTIDVGIKLKVKPHITANNMVFMEIEVEKSSLGAVTGSTAETLEKKAKTQVLLANGETTVIGGIYEDEQNYTDAGVPGLSNIPFLGWLFKSKIDKRTKRELLVFITPRIQNQ
ncbi:MAG: type IV pilus secretin PilQ [Calditerrivibrio sp.]|nr:type IV pilus secretin PilQ [Calditerrivibrio sp.]MCA1933612.1 type IV pilus secretin PilQ [Calditerrivibrio sp.]MCA1980639.1 type IV pilus secretin PilQ [Calditerrivibrio sp.]